MVQLRILGTLELTATDGRDLEPLARQSKCMALLCYLAAAVPHRLQRRDTLLALFWPEHDETHARASLSQALYVLRNELGEQAIVTRGDGDVGLSSDVVWCDVRAFEAALAAGKPGEALALYRGGLLEGFHLSGAPEFERWLERERERLRERAAEGAWALAEAQATADAVQAARWARWAAALAPADEAVIRRLMTFLHRLGDRAAALRAYEAFAYRLTQEYELEPSAETQAMAEGIRREQPATAQAAIRDLPTPSSQPSGPEPARPRRPRLMASALGAAVVVAALGLGVVAQRRSATASTFQHIAVLPLANLTGDTAQEYFVAGMHDAVVTELAKIRALSVISRSSVLKYRNSTMSVPEIARELHVDAVVEGSVVLAGDSVRIDAQLIDGSTDRHLWADSFVKSRRQIPALYGDVAQAIADEVRAAVTPEERGRLTHTRPVDPQANDLYLRGKYDCESWNEEDGFQRGIAFFRRAIDQDSTFALAYEGLAACYADWAISDNAPATDVTPLARAAAARAIELDSTLGLPHATLAWIRFVTDFDFVGPEQEFRRAVALSPGSAWIIGWYGSYLTFAGRLDEGIRLKRQAVELDPRSFAARWSLGWDLHFARHYDESTAELRRTLDIEPSFFSAHLVMAANYALEGMLQTAVAQCDSAIAMAPHPNDAIESCGWVWARAGRRKQALEALRILTSPSHHNRTDPVEIAKVYLNLGDRDRAIAWLRRAARERFQPFVFVKTDPVLDPLRSDPRFQALLRELKMAS